MSKDKVSCQNCFNARRSLRAEFIAETFLEDVEQVNGVKNMLAFTGKYKGKLITVMGSEWYTKYWIYSYELYKFYDVESIIRVGSAGAYTDKLKLWCCFS